MTKEQLEEKKLQLEIKKLGTKWYSNLEFWKVIIPTIAILASLYFAFGKGIIDSEKSKLEIQKEQLKLDITKFELRSNELSTTINYKDSIKSALDKEIFKYEIQKKDLLSKISLLNSKLGKTDQEIDKLNSEKLEDKKFYEDQLTSQYQIEKDRLKELAGLKDLSNKKDISIASLNAEIEYLKPKIKLDKMQEADLSIKKNEAAVAELDKQINSYKNSIQRLQSKYEAEMNRINKMSAEELLREFELNMLKSKDNNFR